MPHINNKGEFVNPEIDKIEKKEKEDIDQFCRRIIHTICLNQYDDFIIILKSFVNLPKSEGQKRYETIKTELSNDSPAWNTIKIEELFSIYDNREQIPSILFDKKFKEFKEYQKIIENLSKFIKEQLGIEIPNNDFEKITNTLFEYKPSRCTIITHDEPELNPDDTSSYYKDYTLDKLADFINIKSGYCVPIYDLAINILSNQGNITFKGQDVFIKIADKNSIIDILTSYFKKEKDKQKSDFIDDVIRILIDKYSRDNILFLLTNAVDVNIKTLILTQFNEINKEINEETFKNEFKKFLILTPNYIRIIFLNLLSGDFKKQSHAENISKLYYSSSNTLFELVGLLGYTYFSDMLTEMANDGNNFQISSQCTDKFIELLNKLKDIKIKNENENETNLSKIFCDIKFDTKGINEILKELGQMCTHGVGKLFLRYYLECYEAFSLYSVKILTECDAINRANTNTKLRPIPCDRIE
jgi:hypothetical protein